MSKLSSILNAESITKKNISAGGEAISIANELNFSVNKSETHAITGHSGSGKTTLLSLLAGLDRVDDGEIQIGDYHLSKMNEDELAQFRAEMIGIIFQQFYLMKHLTAVENVALPLDILRRPNAQKKAMEWLEKVGLEKRCNHLPGELSGGEIQRVAIARACVSEPAVLFADEPTGNLDSKNGDMVANLLFDLVDTKKMTLILVTHNLELARRCNVVWELNQGVLQKI